MSIFLKSNEHEITDTRSNEDEITDIQSNEDEITDTKSNEDEITDTHWCHYVHQLEQISKQIKLKPEICFKKKECWSCVNKNFTDIFMTSNYHLVVGIKIFSWLANHLVVSIKKFYVNWAQEEACLQDKPE